MCIRDRADRWPAELVLRRRNDIGHWLQEDSGLTIHSQRLRIHPLRKEECTEDQRGDRDVFREFSIYGHFFNLLNSLGRQLTAARPSVRDTSRLRVGLSLIHI